MSKVVTVIRKEYLERVRSKSFIIGTLLGPALMSLVIVLPLLLMDSGVEENRTVGVIDVSGEYFRHFDASLRERGHDYITLVPVSVEHRPLAAGVEELKAGILDEIFNCGVVIDADYMRTRQLTFYNTSISSRILGAEILYPSLNRVLRQARFASVDVPDSLQSFLAARADWTTIAISAEGGEEEQDDSSVEVMAISLIMIIYMMVIVYGSHTLTAVIEEKNSRIVEVLLSSISPANLMLGKVLGIGLAGLTQFGIWCLAFFILSQKGVSIGEITLNASFLSPVVLSSFLMFFLLGFFLYATLYAGIGAMCNSVQDSQQFHTPLVMGLVLPMLLLSFVMRTPDATVSVVLSLVPLFSPVLMFMRVCVQQPPLWQIALSWLLLGVSIWIASRMAGKLFRLGILMYGASPTWATLVRALRS